jgi:hypothetical protein
MAGYPINMNKIIRPLIGILFLFQLSFSACKKDHFITSSEATMTITADTIRFDTLFTSATSITQSFKIINDNDQKIQLSVIQLMGGSNSFFKININGLSSTEARNIELAAHDSMYIFVLVNIDTTNSHLPFIVRDSILINYNGNNEYVQLEAYGQNAHFLRNQKISGNVTWTDDLPYVILEKLQIDSTAILNIENGCKIYSHADAPILVDGTLKINGLKNKEVIFAGDRLDEYYRDLPASWPGIYFNSSSKDNEITYAIFKNANKAINVYLPSVNIHPKLILHQCIIDNALVSGIYSENSSIQADNTLISNCGTNINIESGGEYNFTNCTAVSYSTIYVPHINPLLQISNLSLQNGIYVTADIHAVFKNCIIWDEGGVGSDEVLVSKDDNHVFDVSFENCLLKNEGNPSSCNIVSSLLNIDPLFDSIDVFHNYFDFNITKDNTSAVIDNGTMTSFNRDLNDNTRLSGLATDIGCYEKQ